MTGECIWITVVLTGKLLKNGPFGPFREWGESATPRKNRVQSVLYEVFMIELRRRRPLLAELALHGTVRIATALSNKPVQRGKPSKTFSHTLGARRTGTLCGEVFDAQAWRESDLPLIERLENAPEDAIVYVEAIQCAGRSVIGAPMIRFLFEQRNIRALVVNGNIRDLTQVQDFPIWYLGLNPTPCTTKPVRPPPRAAILALRGVGQPDPADAVCLADVDGVVLVPHGLVGHVLGQADQLELIERIEQACLAAGMGPTAVYRDRAWKDPNAITGSRFADVRPLVVQLNNRRSFRQAN